MITPRMTIEIEWTQSFTFFISAKNRNGDVVDPRELSYALFTFDARSFYGTLIQTTDYQGKPGISLSALDAVYYFSDTFHNEVLDFVWPENLPPLKEAGIAIRDALANASFTLDYEAAQIGKMVWHLTEEGTNPRVPFFNAWLNQAIWNQIESDAEISTAWSHVLAAHPPLSALNEQVAAALWMDETEWGIAAGLVEDLTPFVIGLRLTDPYETDPENENEAWQLSVILQDKQDPNLLYEWQTDSFQSSVPSEWLAYETRLQQRLARILQVVPWLTNQVGEDSAIKSELTSDEAWLFLEEVSAQIAGMGYPVFLPAWWQHIQNSSVKVKAKVKSAQKAAGKSYFGLAETVDFDWRIAIGDMELSESEFTKLVAEKRKLIYFRGHWIKVNPDLFRRMAMRMKKIKDGKGLSLRDVFEMHFLAGNEEAEAVNLFASSAEEDAARVNLEVELDTNLFRLMKQLTGVKEITPTPVPESFQGQLRPYQQIGLSWLTFMRTYGLGACLADDMGLGKTVQYIAYLLAAKVSDATGNPSLLICPTSVIGNWQKELKRFGPSLRIYLHYGPRRYHGEEFQRTVQEADLVITSYALAHLDEQELAEIPFASVCLDEAQNIKNAHTKQASSIRKLSAMHRIAMTGTPIENRLSELWSIFDFLNPGYLGSLKRFGERFVTPIERNHDTERTEQITRLVHPFLLRRVKQDPAILLDLPDKVEAKVYVSLTPEQAALYENALTDMLVKLDELNGIERAGVILTTLLKLKQICNHPANYLKTNAQRVNRNGSNKLVRLLEMIAEVRQEGDSCLVFTQFVEMGQLLKLALEKELQENVLFLHGSISKTGRDKLIDSFQNGESGIFILSLKAGGVGLNLTAASHVFHFDRWWNPAVENQATDRAFRIGQTKRVEVHKFVTLGTLEERIDEMIEQKQALSQQIVGSGENWITQMSTSELRELFSLRHEWIDMEA